MVIDYVSLVCLATGVSALPGESVSKPSVPFIKITVSLFPDMTPWHYPVSFLKSQLQSHYIPIGKIGVFHLENLNLSVLLEKHCKVALQNGLVYGQVLLTVLKCSFPLASCCSIAKLIQRLGFSLGIASEPCITQTQFLMKQTDYICWMLCIFMLVYQELSLTCIFYPKNFRYIFLDAFNLQDSNYLQNI